MLVLTQRTIFRIAKADRGSFSLYMAVASLSAFFKHTEAKTAALLCRWIVSGMERFIPKKSSNKSRTNLNSFTPRCAESLAPDIYYNIYQRERCFRIFVELQTVRNHFQGSSRKKEKYDYPQSVHLRLKTNNMDVESSGRFPFTFYQNFPSN